MEMTPCSIFPQLSDKDLAYLEERIKRSSKNRPNTAPTENTAAKSNALARTSVSESSTNGAKKKDEKRPNKAAQLARLAFCHELSCSFVPINFAWTSLWNTNLYPYPIPMLCALGISLGSCLPFLDSHCFFHQGYYFTIHLSWNGRQIVEGESNPMKPREV